MLSWIIAWRYLLSPKSNGAVNVMSVISLAVIAVASCAMVIVLSVFNGFTRLAADKMSALDPDYRLQMSAETQIDGVESLLAELREIEGVAVAAPEISSPAFGLSGTSRMAVTLKGMTAQGIEASGLQRIIVDGSMEAVLPEPTEEADEPTPVILSVGAALGLDLRPSGVCNFTVLEPRRVGRVNPANPMGAFLRGECRAAAVFQSEEEEFDRDIIIMPYDEAARLCGFTDQATSVAVYLAPSAGKGTTEALKSIAESHNLELLDRYRQQLHAFRMIAIEKWITFMMLSFILLIAACNLVATLSMLIIEKRGNMQILSAIGCTRQRIRTVFSLQGWAIMVLGCLAGIVLGTALVLGQQHFGWIKLNAPDPTLMSVTTYPVLLKLSDLLVTLGAVGVVALLVTPLVSVLLRREVGSSVTQ